MKSINEDVDYAKHAGIINELAGKKEAIDKEIGELERESLQDSLKSGSDPIEHALELKPGVSNAPDPSIFDRLSTLRTQSQQLHRAIALQSLKGEAIMRTAGYRVFAQNSDDYIKHASQMAEVVDRLIELNTTLIDDRKVLNGMGCNDIPEVNFPAMGLHEQLANYWRPDLDDQIHRLKLIARTYS